MARRRDPDQLPRPAKFVSVALPDDLLRWGRELPEHYLICRDLGHLWRPYTVHYHSSLRYYERTLRCRNCACERVQQLSDTGVPISNHYRYPEGYQAPKGHGVLSSEARGVLRVASLQAAMGSLQVAPHESQG